MYCDFPVLGRCCFCMPLRRGILTFGYINLILSAGLVGVFSYSLHFAQINILLFRGATVSLPTEACIALHCIDFIFYAILIYGAHKVLMLPMMIFYYYAITTLIGGMLLQIVSFALEAYEPYSRMILFDGIPLFLVAIFIEIYLIILVRSLLKKMERASPGGFENQLQQFVFDGRIAPNGVYNDSTVIQTPPDCV